jgi:hypothetical protein
MYTTFSHKFAYSFSDVDAYLLRRSTDSNCSTFPLIQQYGQLGTSEAKVLVSSGMDAGLSYLPLRGGRMPSYVQKLQPAFPWSYRSSQTYAIKLQQNIFYVYTRFPLGYYHRHQQLQMRQIGSIGL